MFFIIWYVSKTNYCYVNGSNLIQIANCLETIEWPAWNTSIKPHLPKHNVQPSIHLEWSVVKINGFGLVWDFSVVTITSGVNLFLIFEPDLNIWKKTWFIHGCHSWLYNLPPKENEVAVLQQLTLEEKKRKGQGWGICCVMLKGSGMGVWDAGVHTHTTGYLLRNE